MFFKKKKKEQMLQNYPYNKSFLFTVLLINLNTFIVDIVDEKKTVT